MGILGVLKLGVVAVAGGVFKTAVDSFGDSIVTRFNVEDRSAVALLAEAGVLVAIVCFVVVVDVVVDVLVLAAADDDDDDANAAAARCRFLAKAARAAGVVSIMF